MLVERRDESKQLLFQDVEMRPGPGLRDGGGPGPGCREFGRSSSLLISTDDEIHEEKRKAGKQARVEGAKGGGG